MVVSQDKKKAILGCYALKSQVNSIPARVKLTGLDPDTIYKIGDNSYYGDELINAGIILDKRNAPGFTIEEDFSSAIIVIEV